MEALDWYLYVGEDTTRTSNKGFAFLGAADHDVAVYMSVRVGMCLYQSCGEVGWIIYFINLLFCANMYSSLVYRARSEKD